MDHEKKLQFVLKMTKHALDSIPHYDAGGTLPPQNTTQGGYTTQGGFNKVANPFESLPALVNPLETAGNAVGLAGGITKDIGSAFTAQNPYVAGLAPTTNLNYGDPANAALKSFGAGYGENEKLLQEQQALAGTLGERAAGRGPNPAQARLNANTGQNIAQQAALMASQRGSGANAGLIGSQVGQLGTQAQQKAITDSAVLDAEQQIAAQNQLQEQQKLQAGTIQGQQGLQGSLYGASANANNAQNQGTITNYNNAQSINSGVAQNNANAVNKTTGGLLGGAGALLGFLAEGGKVPEHLSKMARIYHPDVYEEPTLDATSDIVDTVYREQIPKDAPKNYKGNGKDLKSNIELGRPLAYGGFDNFGVESSPKVDAHESSKSLVDNSEGVEMGGPFKAIGSMLKSGGKVPGKPQVNHDAYKNDKVLAMLSPGEVVVDLDTLHDKGKLGKMARFVANNIERKKAGRKLT